MNISSGTHINMVFGGPLRHGLTDRVTYNTASECISVWEQRVTRCELKSTFVGGWHAFERPFTPVAWHCLALNLLDSSAGNQANVDTTQGISSTKMMRKHTGLSREAEMRVNHQGGLPSAIFNGSSHSSILITLQRC